MVIDDKRFEDDTPVFDELWRELMDRAAAKHDEYYALGNVAYRLDEGMSEGALF